MLFVIMSISELSLASSNNAKAYLSDVSAEKDLFVLNSHPYVIFYWN